MIAGMVLGFIAGLVIGTGIMYYSHCKWKAAYQEVVRRSLNAYKVYQDE